MSRWLLLVVALAGCETDDFFVSDGHHDCPSDDTDTDGSSSTSGVMPEPLAEITTGPDTTGPAPPHDPTQPGLVPAQERR
jgi:hypothetical protein